MGIRLGCRASAIRLLAGDNTMLSKQLENLLRELSGRDPAEISERFQKARGHSLLPADENTPFGDRQAASALLSLVPERPGYAGLHALVLSKLQPVGGPEASFQGAKNLGDAIALAIARPDDFLELEVLDGEFGVNAYGYASIHHRSGVAHYVRHTALSLVQKGGERDFDPFTHIRDYPIQRKITFQANVINTISRELGEARQYRQRTAKLLERLPVRPEQPQSKPIRPLRPATQLMSVAVHSSIGMKKPPYYFLYKDYEFKLIRGETGESDCLTGRFPISLRSEDFYSVITEFLSAFAFARDAVLIPSPGLVVPNGFSLKKYTGGYFERRKVPINETTEDFYFVAAVRTKEQGVLVRLYRQARAANDVYSSVLFYWHALVYPSTADETGEQFIDKMWSDLPSDLSHLKEEGERILSKPIFSPNSQPPSLGRYIRLGIRHSIAHIVRNVPNSRNIDVDQLDELRHLADVDEILRGLARHRLGTDFGLEENQGPDVFRHFVPEDED